VARAVAAAESAQTTCIPGRSPRNAWRHSSTSPAARASRPDRVSHGGTEAQRHRGGGAEGRGQRGREEERTRAPASRALRTAHVRTEDPTLFSVPPCSHSPPPPKPQHKIARVVRAGHSSDGASRPNQVSHGGTEARRKRGREPRPLIRCARRTFEPKTQPSSPCLRVSVRDLLLERSTRTEAEVMSARQTQSAERIT
jgi:hypothetical protein